MDKLADTFTIDAVISVVVEARKAPEIHDYATYGRMVVNTRCVRLKVITKRWARVFVLRRGSNLFVVDGVLVVVRKGRRP